MRAGITEDYGVIKDILDKAELIWLALVDDEGPYSVPMNFVEMDGKIYLHSGKKGRKAAVLNTGKALAFSAAVDVRMRPGGDDACDQGYWFRSVMGKGAPRIVEGDERMAAFDEFSMKYLGKVMPLNEKYLPATVIYAIDVESVTARVKG